MQKMKNNNIPNILKSFREGEGFDYLDQCYESIDYEKHEEFVKNGNN
jgi:hypothetical protein